MSPLELDAYFARIGYDGSPRVDERTLTTLHAAHLSTIAYENLDLQLGEPKRQGEAHFIRRLVTERRGGWCFEMNGLLLAALRAIGFDAQLVSAAVGRAAIGDAAIGTHAVLLVELGRRLVADVGLGDGPLYPFPLEARRWSEGDFEYRLQRIAGGWWQFDNHPNGLAPRFEFDETPRALAWFEPRCAMLQRLERSPFVALAMAFRRDATRVRALRDVTYIEIDGRGRRDRRVSSGEEYAALLDELIGALSREQITRLWTLVSERAARRDARAARSATSAGS